MKYNKNKLHHKLKQLDINKHDKHKTNIDDKAWIREDTLTMLLAIVRLMHLQEVQNICEVL